MTSIKRYAPYVTSLFGCTAARMGERSDGGYVTYESHRQKMNALQSRIDTLESMQKRKDFDDTLNDMIVKIGKSIHKALDSEFSKKPKFTIKNDGIQINTGTSAVKLGALDEIKNGVYINDAVINAGSIKSGFGCWFLGDPANAFKVKSPEPKKQYQPALLCIKSVSDSFIAGESYPYGYTVSGKDKAWFVSGDEFVSDLDSDDGWVLEDCGAYLATRERDSEWQPYSIFKKP